MLAAFGARAWLSHIDRSMCRKLCSSPGGFINGHELLPSTYPKVTIKCARYSRCRRCFCHCRNRRDAVGDVGPVSNFLGKIQPHCGRDDNRRELWRGRAEREGNVEHVLCLQHELAGVSARRPTLHNLSDHL